MAAIENVEDQIAASILLVLALSSIVANGCAIYMLQTKKSKTIADMLVFHLIVSEFSIVAWNLIFRPIVWFGNIPHTPMIRMVVSQFLSSLIYQSIIFISFDRLLAARLNVRYKVNVTKDRLILVIMLMWVLSILSATICGIDSSSNTIIWIFWSLITIIAIVISYLCIFMVLYKRKQMFKIDLSYSFVRRFNFEIPLFITVSCVLTMLIPDIVCVVDHTLYSMWILVTWYTNFLVHPLVYVFFRVYKQRSVSLVPPTLRFHNIATITTRL